MRIIVFDTETIALEKCFTYNVGYIVYDTDTAEILEKQDFIIEQIWHNIELFQTAYYADKRPLYVSAMKGKRARMLKFGHAMRKISKAIQDYEISCGYAYNSPFDEKVFAFNCDWYKVANPLDMIPIYDIRGLVHNKIAFTQDFKDFCDSHEYYTESGNYSTTAETLYRYLYKDTAFEEAHTALADSEIELEILLECLNRGCELNKIYEPYRSVPRKANKGLLIIDKNLQSEIFSYDYTKSRISKRSDGITITLE